VVETEFLSRVLLIANERSTVPASAMVTVSPLRMQDRRSALRALFNELCSAQNAIELLFQHVREVTTFWAKTVAVDALRFAGHEHPSGVTHPRSRENACEIRRFESAGGR
jgi:hypothetical protein